VLTGNTRAAPWIVVVTLALAWVLVDGVLLPPAFGQTDIYYFKDAGINFAEGRGLTTRFTYGNPSFAYRDYAHYPPVYPLLFGWYARAAGVSARSNQIFNSIIASLVGVLGFLALRPLCMAGRHPVHRVWMEIALAAASIVTGLCYLSDDRPDGLAVAFGLGALMLSIRGRSSSSAVAAGALCALAAFTSPFAGVWTCCAVTAGVCLAGGFPPHRPLSRVVQIGLGGLGAALAALLLLRAFLPGWFDGFLGVATGSDSHNETGGGYFLALLHGDLATWWSGFGYSGAESYAPLARLAVVAAGLVCVIATDFRQSGGGRDASRHMALLALAPMALVIAPYQANYATITAALLIGAWASAEAARFAAGSALRSAPDNRAAMIVIAVFCCNVIVTAPFEARELAVRSRTGGSMQRAVAFLATHRELLEAGTGYAAVSPAEYILWRQLKLHPLINIYSGFRDPQRRKAVRILALSYPGSSNLSLPQAAPFFPAGEYATGFEPVLPQPATLLGLRLSRSSQTWESAVLIRRP
jgi:hypothetical protein